MTASDTALLRGTCVSEDAFPAPRPAAIDLVRQATLVLLSISHIQSWRIKALLLSCATTTFHRDLISFARMDA